MAGLFIFFKIMNVVVCSYKVYMKEFVSKSWSIEAIFFNGPGPKIVRDWRKQHLSLNLS
jgi:hypothetical protein